MEARRGKHPPFFPRFRSGRGYVSRGLFFFRGGYNGGRCFRTTGWIANNSRGLVSESTSFRIINSPVTDISRPGGGDRNATFVANELDYSLSSGFRSTSTVVCFCFLFFSFFLSFLVGYRLIILLRYIFFFLQTFLVEEKLESMRCELDRSRFHVSFNVFRAVRVIDDL